MSKNLTGNKRIVKDGCIDLYNSVQKWKGCTSDSHATVVSMCVLRQKQLSDEELFNQGLLEDDSSFATVSTELLQLSYQLEIKLKNLDLVLDKMRKVSKKLRSILELSELEQSRDLNFDSFMDPVLFQCWPLSRFCEVSEEIEKMHFKDLQIKHSIAKELCILKKKSQLTLFESYWKYEPYINMDRINELLEAIISELELFSQIS